MIRDPGGTSPNENLDSPPSPKYDRIAIQGRPSLDDTEIPLDMTVRRKDSSDGMQGSPPPGSDLAAGQDAPINLNVRPSVITKAPPPPIKKRISHMHTNGEIVLKSTVRTTNASGADSTPIVNLSTAHCDVSIEEHFRRSLGPTYSSIYGDKQPPVAPQQQQQQQPQGTLKLLSKSTVATLPHEMHAGHPVNHPLPVQLLLQKSLDTHVPPPTPNSPVSLTTVSLASSSPSSSLASSPAPFLSLQPQQQQQQQPKRSDSGEEVDDHFAKALGDTWKKIQENKMNL
uniref:Transcription cofactor vestigial-like protein 4 n=1 Tax=Anopheles albimanus TaxID=7167 RepID=A0A182FUF8_ANOAL